MSVHRPTAVTAAIPWILALAALLALPLVLGTCSCPGGGGESEPGGSRGRPHHVVLIVVDTLRADSVSIIEPSGIQTPAIDSLARDGVVFTRASTPSPWTMPAMASVMTGLPPAVHRATRYTSRLPDAAPTLAGQMHKAGYHTAAAGWNWFLRRENGFPRGFDEYFMPVHAWFAQRDGFDLDEVAVETRNVEATGRIRDFALEWFPAHKDEDFFLWLHFFDPHLPYSPPEEYLPPGKAPKAVGNRFGSIAAIRKGSWNPDEAERAWIRGLYDGEIRYVDASIADIFSRMRELGIYDEALIVLVSDHGEEFWEHGSFEHGHTLYEELLHVPLIVKPPDPGASRVRLLTRVRSLLGASAPAPRKADCPVSILSIMATILDYCGLEHSTVFPEASSLVPVLRAALGLSKTPGGPALFSTGLLYGKERESVAFENWKYLRCVGGGCEEIYDLAADPGEKTSLIETRPDIVMSGRKLLAGHRSAALRLAAKLSVTDGEEFTIDEETRKQLESIGYLW